MAPLEILTSLLIPPDLFVHGFPTRHGGVSTGKRATLNLGYRWGDVPDNVAENRRRVAHAAGFDGAKLRVTQHVHGTQIWVVGDPLPEPTEFDGLVTATPGDTLAAFAADCIPMLFADPMRRVVAAVHAGWRGTLAGVAVMALRVMTTRFSCQPRDVRVALGPSIGPCCFEVGPEVAAAFQKILPMIPNMGIADSPKPHIDLRRVTRFILEEQGVIAEHIDDTPPCTRCNPDRFFSYRRDGMEGGVHMGFIGLR